MGKSSRAFTITELIVVMAVIIVLASVGVAGANHALNNAKATKSLNNLRQIGIAVHCFAAENDGLLPQSKHDKRKSYRWGVALKEYVNSSMFISPLDTTARLSSYGINDFVTINPAGAPTLNYSRLQSIPAPAQTLYMAVLNANASQDTDHFHFAEEGYGPTLFAGEIWVKLINNSSSTYLFVDGHVANLKWTDVQLKLTQLGSRFIRPDGHNIN